MSPVRNDLLSHISNGAAINVTQICTKITLTTNTLKLAKSKIFGGFAEKAWDSTGRGHEEPKAFIWNRLEYFNV